MKPIPALTVIEYLNESQAVSTIAVELLIVIFIMLEQLPPKHPIASYIYY